ncbi:MAG: transposase family protein [bacterium]|nr:transposase family protein [bacterium]
MKEPLKGHSMTWAQFRFSVIGGLLARPPAKGKLQNLIASLAKKLYLHPTKGTWVSFGFSTIERWYYQALGADDPIKALERQVRSDLGRTTAMSPQLIKALSRQYKSYPDWSYQLHRDNLAALTMERPELGDEPSYPTVIRRMKERGWLKKRSHRNDQTPGQKIAARRLEQREVRSYESSRVHSLWHLDFHEGSRVVDLCGEWHTPKALCVLDDRTRLCCHMQWYLGETAEVLIHGLTQAFHKRGLPRSLMTDNGGAMIAHETKNGLLRLGIVHNTTLPYSPYQNGKQESFWGQVEGRLYKMLKRVKPLTLKFLNHATQAWVELEYNRSEHEEIGTTPLNRMLKGQDVSRSAPGSDEIRIAFTTRESRVQRKSDGTIRVKGIRFEIPSRFRHIHRLYVRYRSFALSTCWLVDSRTDDVLARLYPQDKEKNADGRRRRLPSLDGDSPPTDNNREEPIPPLLRKLLRDYAATGLPPAYLPKEEVEITGDVRQKGGDDE